MLATWSAQLNASNGTLPLPSNVRFSKRETKPDVRKLLSPSLRSDSTSKGEEKLGYI